MKFSIITPTYKRSEELSRCVTSVLNQNYQDFEMIIVNDSPDDESYKDFEKNISDNRIKYFKNEKNMGVNYTRNFALDNLSKDSDYIIFLDDDDWFANDTLSNFAKLIKNHTDENWLVTNRAYESGKYLTIAPKNNTHYNYAFDYLIFRNIKGDATHCIKTNKIKNIRFSKKNKQGDEWFFFYQLGLKNKFFYSSHNSTLSEGYDVNNGLNFRKQNKFLKIKNTLTLLIEGIKLNIAHHSSFLFYILIRILITIFK